MSISFNGTSSKLTRTGNPLSALSVTIFCWIKPTSSSTSYMVGGIGDLTTTATDELMIYADGAGAGSKVKAISRDSASTAAASTTAIATSWQPAMAVFTSTTSRTIYYAGGAAVTDTAFNNPSFTNIDRIVVGVRGISDTLWFSGEIAHFALWSSALTQGNFDSLAAGAVPDTISSGTLVDYWSLATQAATQTGVNGLVLTASNTSQGSTDPSVGSTRSFVPRSVISQAVRRASTY